MSEHTIDDVKPQSSGGGGSNVGDIKTIHTNNALHTAEDGTVWLRTGVIETDVASYPDAQQQTQRVGVTGLSLGGLLIHKTVTDAGLHTFLDSIRKFEPVAGSLLSMNNTAAAVAAVGQATSDALFVNAGINATSKHYLAVAIRAEAGFLSVKKYKGLGGTTTIDHGLGQTVGLAMVKSLGTGNWMSWLNGFAASDVISPDTNGPKSTSGDAWANTAPTNTQLTVGANAATGAVNTDYMAYVFANNAAKGIVVGLFTPGANPETVPGLKNIKHLITKSLSSGDWVARWNINNGSYRKSVLNTNAAVVSESTDVIANNTFKITGAGQHLYIAFGDPVSGSPLSERMSVIEYEGNAQNNRRVELAPADTHFSGLNGVGHAQHTFVGVANEMRSGPFYKHIRVK